MKGQAAVLAAAAVVAALTIPVAASAAPASVGVGVGAGDVCLPVTAQPGHTYQIGDVTVQDTGSDTESISLRVTAVTTGLAAHLNQVPARWVTFGSSAVTASSGQMIPVPVTLTVPAGAAAGPYESSIIAGTVSPAPSGPGGHVVFGAAAETGIVFTVGPSKTPPPPCTDLTMAQATGKFPAWPTKAFATTSWAQEFADEGSPGPASTPQAAAASPAATPAGRAPVPVLGWVIAAALAAAFLARRRRSAASRNRSS